MYASLPRLSFPGIARRGDIETRVEGKEEDRNGEEGRGLRP